MDDENIKLILASKLLEEGVGSVKLKEIYSKYKKKGGLKFDQSKVDDLAKKIRSFGIGIVGFWEDSYPWTLLQLRDHPVLLFYRGDIKLLKIDTVTIVGTRRASIYGIRITRRICNELATKGICGVSGLAYGIDARVHRAFLDFKEGKTIAVVAGGVDRGYPLVNQAIHDDICKENLLLAEFPPGKGVKKGMFPMRNRILAALSSHTIVIEAPSRSGSLITAQQALDLNREVYGVPGDIYRDSAKGVNQLITDGASVINSMADVSEIVEKSRIFFSSQNKP